MKLLSIELLSEVLGFEVDEIDFDKESNEIEPWSSNNYGECHNIYELAHRCKVWAIESHFMYVISGGSTVYPFDTFRAKVKYSGDTDTDFLNESEYFYALSEPEAIFMACEWILNRETIGSCEFGRGSFAFLY